MRSLLLLSLIPLAPVYCQIAISPAALPTGQVNTAYSQTLSASGGAAPYAYTLLSGSFPSGLPAFAISSDGIITGTPDGCPSFEATPWQACPDPNEPIDSTFTVQATDSLGATGTQSYTIGVYWNPTQAQFLASFTRDDIHLTKGLKTFGTVPFGIHLKAANAFFRQPSTDNLATWNAWVDELHAVGGTVLNFEPDMDCIFNNFTNCLALYAGTIAHAHSLGMTISLNPEYYSTAACGDAGCGTPGNPNGEAGDCQNLLGYAINATPGNGVQDWFTCVTTPIPALGMSAYQYMISHWLANGDRFVPVHEPTTMANRWGEGVVPGACSSTNPPEQSTATCMGIDTMTPGGIGNTCPMDWLDHFLKPLLNPHTGLIHKWTKAAGIGIRIGVTTLRQEDVGFTPPYSDYFARELPASVDLGYDIYYFGPFNFEAYKSSIHTAQKHGHKVFVEEFAPQRWVMQNAQGQEVCALKGCYSCDWQTSQSDQNFMAAFLPWAASEGALSASLFPGEMLSGCTTSFPDNCQNTSVLAQASANFMSGNSSPLAQRIAAIMTPGGDMPKTVTATAGNGQSVPAGQAFPTDLAINVTDAGGFPILGASVTFTVVPGDTGAGASFASTQPAVTDLYGNATASALTTNSVPGTFTVTATAANGVTATFSLASTGFALASASIDVGNGAGKSVVLLSGNGQWTATSQTSWLHAINAGGSSGAAVLFHYAANPSGKRTGTLSIAGTAFTVNQAGSRYLPVFPLTGLITAGLSRPHGVASDSQGNVYIADSGNDAIKELNAGSQTANTLISSGLQGPEGIAVNAHGNVYIADTGNHAIKEWNPASKTVTTLVSTGLNQPSGIAVDSQGNVYFSDTSNNTVKEWVAASRTVSTLVSSGLKVPRGVAIDALGNIYIADSGQNAIKEWDRAGKQLTTLVSSGLSGPSAVTVDGDGNVSIADTGNDAIKQWNPATGQVASIASSGVSAPRGLALDAQGDLYAADIGDSSIQKLVSAFLYLGVMKRTVAPAAGSDSIAVHTLPASTVVRASSDQSWLTVTNASGGSVGFSYQANTASSQRVGHITVLGLQVTVTQRGAGQR